MNGLTSASCELALPPGGGAPEWVHLLPAGHIEARDGRTFDLGDPAALILAFEAGGVDLPVDFEHQADDPDARRNGPVPAAGWIKELSHDDSGLWGRVEWTAAARELIERKEYRYLSPVFLHNKAGQIMRLTGAGLVHRPALRLKALAAEELPMPAPDTAKDTTPRSALLDRLAELLKLKPDVTEDEALEALEAWLADREAMPDPKKFIPAEAVAQMLQQRHLERATMAEAQAAEKVKAALRDGYITPGMREWAAALCRQDPAAFDDFLKSSGPVFAHLSKRSMTGVPPGSSRPAAQSDIEAAICRQLGLKPEQLSGD